ncbi:MAG: hypothetical protein QW632_01505 [Ignisphaera sp.]
MITEVIKALFYACNSYPKVSAPHRYSLSDDFELCVLSSILPATTSYDSVYNIVVELRSGRRTVRELEIGKMIAKNITTLLKELGYNIRISIVASTTIFLYVDAYLSNRIEKDFHEAVKKVFNALNLTPSQETVELLRIFNSVGGELRRIIDVCELTERRILTEDLSLGQLFSIISRYSRDFTFFTSPQRILDVLTMADNLFKSLQNVNAILVKIFLELAKDETQIRIDFDKVALASIIKMDLEMRKKGVDLTHLMPYVMLASLYLVKTKL